VGDELAVAGSAFDIPPWANSPGSIGRSIPKALALLISTDAQTRPTNRPAA
jgi:hypothetical protein